MLTTEKEFKFLADQLKVKKGKARNKKEDIR